MRKYQQRQILSLLQTIKQAQSLNLYADCRESAAGIGAFIDSVEGKGTQTAKILADYCELLSKACNNPVDEQQLRKYLAMIDNGIRHELKPPDKIEVVFFPYNVSKFDSLESIYLAAKNDPLCDAYVVPIPYYNLLPDRSFGQLHYEGHLYPDNIPITAWQEYDVETRCPDIIFIHTPYDEDNLVTSIHPDFYSERLRNFTGLLVYVPYFVCIDDVPEWLCVHSGTVYADKIIVQSEKVKQTYIRVFKEVEKENNCEKIFGNLDDKIVVLGSPKFDKTLNTKREDCHLPDKWRALIERPDGTCKKVIFYNTSLGSLLQGNAQYLKKLKSVLEIFRKRDDVVLWWRPHPLSKNTYKAMRPHLLEEYEQIVAEYRNGGWGIYDDTPDLHRAIAISDAYFGDLSSIVALFQTAGKPIMISNSGGAGYNMEIFNGDARNMYFLNFSKESNQYGWAYAAYFNALFKIDFINHSVDVRYVGKGTSLFQSYLHAHSTNDSVLILPYYAHKLLIYSKTDGCVDEIELDDQYIVKDNCGSGYKLAFAVKVGKKIIMLGHPNGLLVEYDISSKELAYNNYVAETLFSFAQVKPDTDSYGAINIKRIVDGSKLWIGMFGLKVLAEYDSETGNCRLIGQLEELADCEANSIDGNVLWVIPKGHLEIIRWNFLTGEIVRYNNFPTGYNPDVAKKFFNRIINCGKYLLLIPAFGNMVIKFLKSSGAMSEVCLFEIPKDDKGVIYKFDSFSHRTGNKLLLLSRWDRAYYEYDIVAQTVSKYRFKASEEGLKKYIKGICSAMDLAENTQIWDTWFSGNPLENYFEYLNVYFAEQNQTPNMTTSPHDGKSGENIYTYVKNLILSGE